MAEKTVLVLGAGAAGLAAARALRRGGARVVVIEGRDRMGGRVDTRADPILGVPRERGAEFVHGRPPLVRALAREAGVRLLPVPASHRVVRRRGRAEEGGLLSRSQELLSRNGGDGESAAALLARARRRGWAGPEELALARAYVEGFYLADPRTASAGAIARMDRALAAIGADRTFRAEAGWGAVLAPLAAEARARPGELRLGVIAERIRWRPGAVAVEGRGPAGGALPPLRGDRLVVTVPVGVLRAGSLRFRPEPRAVLDAAGRLEMGPVVKVLLRFHRPPWDQRGPRRPGFVHLPGAPVPVFWTLAPHRVPLLVGWVGGPGARRLSALGPSRALRATLRGLAPAFHLEASALEDRLDGAELVDWSRDPLAGGGYAVFPVGSSGASEELARPVAGTLFFAGEATEPDLAGTVEGALRSGERAARQVLASL